LTWEMFLHTYGHRMPEYALKMDGVKIVEKRTTRNPIILLSRLFCKILAKFGVDLMYDERTTTQGNTIYIGSDWVSRPDHSRFALIMHELEHVRQWRTWWLLYPISYILNIWQVIGTAAVVVVTATTGNLGFLWLLIFSIIGLGFLPAGLSMRGYWEMKAFAVSMRSMYECNMNVGMWLVDYYTKLICGDSYLYALSFIKKRVWLYFAGVYNALGGPSD
jgi:hypothetical protein